MAPTKKERTKTDLDHALRRCIDKREELQEALEDQSATLSIEEIKSDLDELNEKWECVVTADWSFVDIRVYCVESDAQELETFYTKYNAEMHEVSTITNRLEEMTRLQQAARLAGYNHPLPPPATQQKNRDQYNSPHLLPHLAPPASTPVA